MNKKHKFVEAYLTIEASFLLPMAVIVTCFIIIYLFYLYNCCVVYQSCYISALRGSQMMDKTTDEISEKVEIFTEELLDNQIYDFVKEYEVSCNLFAVKTEADSEVKNILNVFDIVAEEEMEVGYCAEAKRIDPVMVLRLKN